MCIYSVVTLRTRLWSKWFNIEKVDKLFSINWAIGPIVSETHNLAVIFTVKKVLGLFFHNLTS